MIPVRQNQRSELQDYNWRMDHFYLDNPDCGIKPDDDDELMQMLQKYGYKHEAKTLEGFQKDGKQVYF